MANLQAWAKSDFWFCEGSFCEKSAQDWFSAKLAKSEQTNERKQPKQAKMSR